MLGKVYLAFGAILVAGQLATALVGWTPSPTVTIQHAPPVYVPSSSGSSGGYRGGGGIRTTSGYGGSTRTSSWGSSGGK